MQSHDYPGNSFLSSASGVDGAVVRVRVPGGRVRAAQWEVLADVTDEFGDGGLSLTARGNLQIRGVGDVDALSARLVAHGFAGDEVPSVLCSPLSPDLMELVDALVAASAVSGTVFGIDAGDGSIMTRRPDVGVIASGNGERFQMVVAGEPTGLLVSADRVVEALVSVAEHGDDTAGMDSRLGDLIVGRCAPILPVVPPKPVPIGWMQDGDTVALGAGLREGQLDSRLARFLAAIGTDIRITPWRSLVIHGLSDGVADQVVKVLAPMGLIFDANSPWLRA